VYFASKADCRIDVGKVRAKSALKAFWIDPRTGDVVDVKVRTVGSSLSVSTPSDWEDALLVVEGS